MRLSVRVGLRWLAVVIAVAGLAGCGRKVALQHAADVRQASEIAAVLGARGIEVERKPEKAGVMLYVGEADFAQAMQALREAGLLRPSRQSVDEALGKRGIAPTPLEERLRHVHVVERDLEAALMDIDGVIAARVRVVPPERPSPGAPLMPASASVLVKHRAGVDLSPLLPGIAKLVKNGAPGLAGEDDRRVTVLLVPEQPNAGAGAVSGGNANDPPRLPSMPVVAGAAGLGFLAHSLLRRVAWRRPKGGKDGGVDSATPG
jgi:type III secretion protein J